jgi:small subunit ribosomal protein S4
MANITKPACKYCKSYGAKLYLKGKRCETVKCPMDPREKKKRFVRQRKISEYGMQLKEKNKVKRYYGVFERQFRRYFDIAKKSKGVTGEILLQLLERRLDNVIQRANWASSKRMAKQIVNHGLIFIGGRKNDRPGYIVNIGEEVYLKPNSKYAKLIKGCMEEFKERTVPGWLQIDRDNLKIKILRFPEREEVTLPINEQLIVNLYSK